MYIAFCLYSSRSSVSIPGGPARVGSSLILLISRRMPWCSSVYCPRRDSTSAVHAPSPVAISVRTFPMSVLIELISSWVLELAVSRSSCLLLIWPMSVSASSE
eukprot:765649-Hanusia_phi.AAC.1